MDSAIGPTPSPLDIKTLLARINQRIVLLRMWLSHDHHDDPYWWARRTTAPPVQHERSVLRRVADLLHVERAAQRGRLHGTRFASIEAQRAWLEKQPLHPCSSASDFTQLPSYATLTLLREAKLPL